MKTETLTVRLPTGTKARIAQLASVTNRSQSYVVDMAIQEYLEINEWQVVETARAVELADSDHAAFTPHAEVKARWESRRED